MATTHDETMSHLRAADSAHPWDPAKKKFCSSNSIHRIPGDLLSDIFQRHLDRGGSLRDLVPVCRIWRDLAFASPRLWSGILWVTSKPSAWRQGWARSERLVICQTLEDLRRTLSRAKAVPLDLVIEVDVLADEFQDGLALLTENGRISQWRKIYLHHSLVPYNDHESYSRELSVLGGNLFGLEEADFSVEVPILFDAIARTATKLHSLRVESVCHLVDFPKGDWWERLRKLEVKVHWMDEWQAMLSDQQRHEQYGTIISSCINLEELLLFHIPLPTDSWSAPSKLLSLTGFETGINFHNHGFPSTLTHLTIDNHVDHLDGTFSLPSLRHLRYTFEEFCSLPALGQLIAPVLERLELVGYKFHSNPDYDMEEEFSRIWGNDAQSSNRLNPRSLSITNLHVRSCILIPALRHMPAIEEMELASVLASKEQEFYIPFLVTRRNPVENVVCPRLGCLTVELVGQEALRRGAVEETMIRLVRDRKKRGVELRKFRLRWSRKEGSTNPGWINMLSKAREEN
jgi:hypothetical protein